MIHTIIEEMKQQFSQHFKPFLNPPATMDEIEAAEAKMGVAFPDDLKALYLTHNGEMESGPGLFFGLPFLSLDDMLSEWQTWVELSGDAELDAIESYSVPDSWIKEQYINRYWLPIAIDYGGNHLGIDMDPGSEGIRGQVINFGRDEEVKYVIAHNLADLLAFIVQTLKNGTYTIDEEDHWSYGEHEEAHFFDVLSQTGLPVFHAKRTETTALAANEWFDGLSDEWKEIVRSMADKLEQFSKKKVFYLMGKHISDLAPLAVCEDAREVVLSGNDVTDLAPLQSLSALKRLYIGGNPVTDLTPLTNLTKLSYLNISKTAVTSLHPLASLPSLKELAVEHASVSDYRVFGQMKKLRTLSVSIRNAEQLADLTDAVQLKGLHIYGLIDVRAADFHLLAKLKNVTDLTIERTVFNEVSFLSSLQKLQRLTFVDCSIRDISAVSTLERLAHLELSGTPAGHLEAVAASSSLQSFAGAFSQFYTLQALMDKVDFSKIIGHMTEEEREIWHKRLDI